MQVKTIFKYLCLFIGITLLCGIILVHSWPQSIIIFQNSLHNSVKQKPYLYIIPFEKQINEIKFLNNSQTKLKFNRLNLIIPWKVKNQKSFGKATLIDKKIIVKEYSLDYVSFFDQCTNEQKITLSKFFGIKALKSNYDFEKIVLQSTPAQINLKSNMKECVTYYTLVTLKEIMLVSPASLQKIYTFEKNNYKGIEFNDNKSLIEIFNNQGDLIYSIIIFDSVTDEEKNFILSSININK